MIDRLKNTLSLLKVINKVNEIIDRLNEIDKSKAKNKKKDGDSNG